MPSEPPFSGSSANEREVCAVPRPELVLASGSRIRAQLLRAAGVAFTVAPARIDETAMIAEAVQAQRSLEQLAVDLAEAKAATGDGRENAVILGSDQLLAFRGAIFETPESVEAAVNRLKALAGETHQLICGYALRRGGETVASGARVTHVHMRAYSDAALDDYVAAAGDALTTTVGGYEIEGLGLQLIDRIEGDYFAALGLPMFDVMSALRATGVLIS